MLTIDPSKIWIPDNATTVSQNKKIIGEDISLHASRHPSHILFAFEFYNGYFNRR